MIKYRSFSTAIHCLMRETKNSSDVQIQIPNTSHKNPQPRLQLVLCQSNLIHIVFFANRLALRTSQETHIAKLINITTFQFAKAYREELFFLTPLPLHEIRSAQDCSGVCARIHYPTNKGLPHTCIFWPLDSKNLKMAQSDSFANTFKFES